MIVGFEEFQQRARSVERVVARAARACGRDPQEVRIMAVTKSHPAHAVEIAARYGLRLIGENRVQEAAVKMDQVAADVEWELIGHLQTNKARVAVALFDRIQSVDRPRILQVLDRVASEREKVQRILLQVNSGDDPRKFGVSCDDAPELLRHVLQCSALKVEGLMTIAPFDQDPSVAATAFGRLRDLRDELENSFDVVLPELSMGMTGDLAAAIKAGSTCVRVGTAFFGARE